MGWPVSYAGGKLEFSIPGGGTLTLPNQAMVVTEYGFTQLWSSFNLVHENRDTASSTVAYPGVYKGSKASIPLLITGDWNPSGTPYTNWVKGLALNVGILNKIAGVTASASNGLQTVTFTPYPSATPLTKSVQVYPLQLGTNAKQGGTTAVLDLVLPDGPFVVV